MRDLNKQELEQVHGAGGTDDGCKEKGNNGWGNGADPLPPGGGVNDNSQSASKEANEER